jgi:hypothetical protein
MKMAAPLALFAILSVASCVSDPVKKGKPGTMDVMTGGVAGAAADPTGAAGDPTGAAGATADPSGAAGDPSGAAGATTDPSTAAGGTGATADPTGAAGSTTTSTGAAGAAAPIDASGAAGAGDAGVSTGPDTSGPPPITDPCDHRTWSFTPSVVCTSACAAMSDAMKLPANAIDGNTATRYTTGITQGSKGPELVILGFPKPVTLSGINLFTKAGDGPISYLVEYSLDGANFSYFTPGAMGPGSDNLTVTFPAPTKLLALRITQTGVKKTNWWSIHELTVMGCAAAP